MASIDVIDVENSAQLKQFISFPNTLYSGDPNYVTPLLSERKEFFDFKANPFYRNATAKLFLAKRGEAIVGRIATCIDYRHNDFHEDNIGFFGFFDTIDDYEVAQTLLRVAMITLKKAGMDKMRGPLNFSTNHECGFLIEGYDVPPTVMMPYNHPHQVQLAERFGLKKAMDLLAYRISRDEGISTRVQSVVEKLAKRTSVTIRSLNLRDFDHELERVRKIYNTAWEKNWGFVPMDDLEFEHMARQLKLIVDPRIVLFAEHEGEPIGFSLALPDINQALIHLDGRLFPTGLFKLLWHTKVRRKIDAVRLVIFGVIPQFQKRGVDSMLYVETFKRGTAAGYKTAELSWILETNELMIRAAEGMGAKPYKKYRIVEMPL